MNDEHAPRSHQSFRVASHQVVYRSSQERASTHPWSPSRPIRNVTWSALPGGISGTIRRRIISKLESALQELDETIYWMELLTDSGIIKRQRLEPLIAEANEIIAILVTSVKTIKRRRRR